MTQTNTFWKGYFADFEPEVPSVKIQAINFKRPKSNIENFEFLIKPPYFIVMGDWNPVIYKFNDDLDMDVLMQLTASLRTVKGYDKYLISKVVAGTHNSKFWVALEAMVDKIMAQTESKPKKESK